MSFAAYNLFLCCVMLPKKLPNRLLAALTLSLQKLETKLRVNLKYLYGFSKHPSTSRVTLQSNFWEKQKWCSVQARKRPNRLLAALTLRLQKHETKLRVNLKYSYGFLQYPSTSRVTLQKALPYKIYIWAWALQLIISAMLHYASYEAALCVPKSSQNVPWRP